MGTDRLSSAVKALARKLRGRGARCGGVVHHCPGIVSPRYCWNSGAAQGQQGARAVYVQCEKTKMLTSLQERFLSSRGYRGWSHRSAGDPFCAQVLEGPSKLTAAKGAGNPSCGVCTHQEGSWQHHDLSVIHTLGEWRHFVLACCSGVYSFSYPLKVLLVQTFKSIEMHFVLDLKFFKIPVI